MRHAYLKEYRPAIYSTLLLTEKLFPHLAEIDAVCKTRLDIIETAMMRREGVTEALKAADQMEWVRRMNSIHSREEEIVLHEVDYTIPDLVLSDTREYHIGKYGRMRHTYLKEYRLA